MWGAVCLAVLAGSALRAGFLDAQGLWHDEIHTLALLEGVDPYLFAGADLKPVEPVRSLSYYRRLFEQRGFWAQFPRNIVHEGHPPLYYLALRLVTAVSGTSEAGLRLLSAVSGILLIPVMAYLGLRLGGPGSAVICAGLTASSPFLVFFSHEARAYSLGVLLLGITSVGAANACLRRRIRVRSGLLLLLGATAGAYTHYYLVLANAGIAAAVCWCARGTPLRTRLLVAAAPFALAGLWVPVLQAQMEAHAGTHWTEGALGPAASIRESITSFGVLSGGYRSGVAGTLVILLAVLGAGAGFLRRRDQADGGTPLGMVLGVMLVAHAAAVYGIDVVTDHHTIAVPRYSAGAVVPLILLLGVGLARAGRPGAVAAAVFLTFAAHSGLETASGKRAPRQMIREAAAYLDRHVADGEILAVAPSGPVVLGLAYYMDRDVPVTAAPVEEARRRVREAARSGTGAWLLVQRLGAGSSSHEIRGDSGAVSPIRLAGLDLYHFPGDR